MAKDSSIYVCQKCGVSFPKWSGQCGNCGEWNSLTETLAAAKSSGRMGKKLKAAAGVKPISFSKVLGVEESRIKVGISEFDRVLGGGIVLGSLVLIAGEPGIGKSTLLTQLALRIEEGLVFGKGSVYYVCGEESPSQIKMRIDRILKVKKDLRSLYFLPETNVDSVIATITKEKPKLVIVDSIQTMRTDDLRSSTGSVSQVSECTNRLVAVAKQYNIPIFLVGHVTKEGAIAGPKVLEHMVDAVLELTGDRQHEFRLLRASKNRFGAVDEVGIFSMDDSGMQEVKNPSDRFLSDTQKGVAGSVVISVMEGTRPILVEIQALAVPSNLAVPRRIASGVDQRRVQIMVAVLTKVCGLRLFDKDVYVNVAGGLVVREPASDLGVALAIASSLRDKAISRNSVVIGEVGLLGEVRKVSRMNKRISEASAQGYKKVISADNYSSLRRAVNGLLR